MTWLPAHKAVALFGQTDYWITRDGAKVWVRQMTDSHLRNLIRFLRRNNPLAQITDYRTVMGEGPSPDSEAAADFDRAVVELADWCGNVRVTPLYQALVLERWNRRGWKRGAAKEKA